MRSPSPLLRGGAQVWTWRGFIVASITRELRSRYARSLFGWIWLVLPPAVMIGIYTVVFSRVMRGNGLPDHGPYTYTIFLCAGLLTWQWFGELLSRVVALFTNHSVLLKKTAVPWPALLAVELGVTGFGLAVQLGLFALLLLAVGQWPGASVWVFLPLLALQAVLAVGLGLGLAVLHVFFRDVGMGVPLILQVWFWLTPIVYPLQALPERFQEVLQWNLFTPLITTYQDAVIRPDAAVPWRALAAVLSLASLVLFLSLRMVRRNRGLIRDEL